MTPAAVSAFWQVVVTVCGIGSAACPVCIGVAVLKYRLFDIDRVISRTLAYVVVTGLLVGLYAAIVLLATEVLRFHSTVAVAVATLDAVRGDLASSVQHALEPAHIAVWIQPGEQQ